MQNYWVIILYFLSLTCMAATHHPQDFLSSIAGSKDEGNKIVMHYCITCHAEKPIIPLGAPRIHNKDDWQPRLKQGLNALFKSSNKGKNFMPARGGCFECSDQQLMLAIKALISQEKP
jgi:cytochrome c5